MRVDPGSFWEATTRCHCQATDDVVEVGEIVRVQAGTDETVGSMHSSPMALILPKNEVRRMIAEGWLKRRRSGGQGEYYQTD